MTGPAYRGALCHSSLAAIAADAVHGDRVLAAVDPRHLVVIRTASKLAWIPAVALDDLMAAYLDEAGGAGYLDFWRRYTLGSVDSPLFGALFNGALRIFGRSPAGLLKWIGRAWEVTTHEYGHIEVDTDPEVVVIRVLDIPAAGRRPTVPLSTQASVIGVIEFTDRVPLVTAETADFTHTGAYTITARWE